MKIRREKLRGKLFETCGIANLDLNLLLDVKADDDYKEWRTLILSEIETFVAETKRFATRPSCQKFQYAHHQIQRDNTSVDSVDHEKIPVCLYGLKALYRNTEYKLLKCLNCNDYVDLGRSRSMTTDPHNLILTVCVN